MLQLEAEFDAACREVAALPPEKRAGAASRRGATGRSSSIMSMASRRSSMQPHEQTQQMVSFGSSLLLDHVIALYKLRQQIRPGRVQQKERLRTDMQSGDCSCMVEGSTSQDTFIQSYRVGRSCCSWRRRRTRVAAQPSGPSWKPARLRNRRSPQPWCDCCSIACALRQLL